MYMYMSKIVVSFVWPVIVGNMMILLYIILLYSRGMAFLAIFTTGYDMACNNAYCKIKDIGDWVYGRKIGNLILSNEGTS